MPVPSVSLPRIVFFGTPELARVSLAGLCDSGLFDLAAAVVQPDKPKGRDLRLSAPPVKVEAQQRGLRLLQPAKARDPGLVAELAGLHPDLIVVAAYGQILPQSILDLPKHGCLNVHTSLLPKFRGAAPIQWAILEGEPETGVTLMKMDAGLDTGDIVCQRTTPIRSEDDSQSLHDRLARLGAELLIETIPKWINGQIAARAQPTEGVSYARKITKEDGRLNWSEPSLQIWNRVRALTPWPGTFTHLERSGSRQLLKIWQCECLPNLSGRPGEIIRNDQGDLVVACGTGAIRLLEVQREGGRRMNVKDFLAGHPLGTETTFDHPSVNATNNWAERPLRPAT